MEIRALANGLLIAGLLGSSAIAMAQAPQPPAASKPDAPSAEMQPMPGMHGPGGGHHGGAMRGGQMMGRGMMGGGMMGGCPMMNHLPPGNEKLAMQIHGEIMVAIGNILIKHADSLQARPSN